MLNLSPRLSLSLLVSGATLILFSVSPTQAQIVPDNTLGNENSTIKKDTIKNLPSDVIEGGATRGSNLFHSFQEFNINQGRGGYFNNPEAIRNIFGRVTGSNASKIFGTLGVLGNANLYLINPNGIIFGKNARLDINGAFFGSTADGLVFDNNFEFSATNPSAPPLLTVDIPLGVRFRDNNSNGDINSQANLTTGGDLTLQGNNLNLSGSLQAGGIIQIESQKDIRIDNSRILAKSNNVGGDVIINSGETVDLSNASEINVRAGTNGNVIINAENIIFSSNSKIRAGIDSGLGSLTSQAGDINIKANNVLSIEDSSFISNAVLTGGNGNAGNVIIDVGLLILKNNAQVNSFVSEFGQGNTGLIKIKAQNTSMSGNSAISSSVNQNALGNVGGIEINTNSLSMSDGSRLDSRNTGIGNAGTIEITADDAINISTSNLFSDQFLGFGDSGNINISGKSIFISNSRLDTENSSFGNAGSITIEANDIVNIFADSIITSNLGSFLSLETPRKVGSINIEAKSIFIENNSQLQAGILPNGEGEASVIYLQAQDIISVIDSDIFTNVSLGGNGNGGNVYLTNETGEVTLNNSNIFTNTSADRKKSGDISIIANSLKMTNESDLSSFSQKNQAGNITLVANDIITLDSGSSINIFEGELATGEDDVIALDSGSSINIFEGESATGGNVLIKTKIFKALNGSGILGSVLGSQSGRKLTINADESVEITGFRANNLAFLSPSELALTTFGNGEAGDITINTKQLIVTDGGSITTSSLTNTGGMGDAGSITINASEQVRVSGKTPDNFSFSKISSDTLGKGNAGNIEINTNKLIVNDRGQISSFTLSSGKGGKIKINADESIEIIGASDFISTTFNSILDTSSSGTGTAGDIDIVTKKLTVENGALISTQTSNIGEGGDIIINAAQLVSITSSNPNLLFGTSEFTSETSGKGNAGEIKIKTETITIGENARLSARSRQQAQGQAGNIILNTNELNVAGELGIFAETEGIADAGNLNINPFNNNPNLKVNFTNQGNISASTSGSGNGGDIILNAPQNLKIAGNGTISVITTNDGNAGSIDISSSQLNISDEITINASTSGGGYSGNIQLNGVNLTLDNATIQALTTGQGNPGSILLSDGGNNSENINLTNSTISTEINSEVNPTTARQANITLQTDNLNLDNSKILASTIANTDAGNITIVDSQQINLDNNSQITALTTGSGNAGNLQLAVEDIIRIDNGSLLNVETQAGGNAGNIDINAPKITIGENAQLSARSRQQAQGKAGNIILNTDRLNVAGELGIFAETEGIADAGNLTINPFNNNPNLNLDFSNQGNISASTSGSGNGGDITLTAPQNLDIAGNGTISVITTNRGNGGTINLSATDISLDAGVNVSASTSSSGNSGNIQLNGANLSFDNATIQALTTSSGHPGSILLSNRTNNSENVNLTNTTISTEINAEGNTTNAQRANITLQTDNLNLNNSKILASTNANRDAGNITITDSQQINIDNNSEITALTTGSGSGGNINIQVNKLTLTNEANINTNTSNIGDAGSITINLEDNLSLNKGQILANTNSNSMGRGGDIIINSLSDINLDNRASIQVDSQGQGDGGNIIITGENVSLDDRSSISAETASQDGGNVTINIDRFIRQQNNSDISATAGERGDGGNVTLNAKFLIGRENSDITANAFEGTGGNINITATGNFRDFASDITASSQFGQDGVVEINEPDTDPGEGLIEFSSNVVDANDLIAQNVCRQGEKSEFTVRGKGGLPDSPEEYVSAEEIEVNTISPVADNSTPTTENDEVSKSSEQGKRKIVPARGWVKNEKGELVLVAYANQDSVNRTIDYSQGCSK